MGILDSVLEYKRQKEAQQNADIQAIPQALQAFQAGRQMAQKNLIDELTLKVSAAKSGLDINTANGQITQNPSLLQGLQRNVYSFDPTTNEFSSVATIKKGDVVRNLNTPEDIAAKETSKSNASYNTTKESAQRAFDLRKEFQGLETVKDYQVIKNQVSAMDSLVNKIDTDKNSATALDQGLITLFNKITDPQSVVRESEYERTPQNLPLFNAFGGAFQKLEKGGAGLTNKDRKALVFGAKIIANSRGKIYNETLSNYENLANEFGVKPELVTSGYGKHEDFSNSENISEQKSDKYEYRTVNGKLQRRLKRENNG